MINERATEQGKVIVRWIVIVCTLAAVLYVQRTGRVPVPLGTIVALTVLAAGLNAGFTAVLRRACPPWFKYVTVAADLGIISVLVAVTGGAGSLFYSLYFIVLVSNAIRYGTAMSLYVALAYNVAYVVVLVTAAGEQPPLATEGVKILTFWAIALYAGYLASRYQHLEAVQRSYEETIAELRAKARS